MPVELPSKWSLSISASDKPALHLLGVELGEDALDHEAVDCQKPGFLLQRVMASRRR